MISAEEQARIDELVKTFVEVRLPDQANFLKIRETLTRIGIASKLEDTKILRQSCHILHKRSKYYIVHFKELFALDGKPTDFSKEDLARRNTIANLLQEWKLLEIVNPDVTKDPVATINAIKIIPFREKDQWELVAKYSIGKSKA